MLAKKTSKNQITLPRDAVRQFSGVDYFEVTVEKGFIKLAPVKVLPTSDFLANIRTKIAELGLEENVVEEAIEWARGNKK